jgi:long-chain fatty acid transport protein
LNRGILAAAFVSSVAGSAFAGGLERGGYDIDLLFDPGKAAFEAGVTYVNPQRDIKNARDTFPADGTVNGETTARDTESYTVPYFGVKAQIFEGVDCLADYSQPWGVHSAPGAAWSGAQSVTEIHVKSRALSATCSYKTDMGKGDIRFIGGVTRQEVWGFKEALVAPGLTPFGFTGIGRLDLDSDGVGWRAGVAYEIQEYALRASLLYNSKVDLGEITGTLDLSQVPAFINPANPLLGRVNDVFGTAEMPQSIELKLQSGIAPDWLAFGSVKWTDWSTLQSVSFCPTSTKGVAACRPGSATEATSLDLLYRDGWTIAGGIGHKFNEQWSGAVSLTWDRGTTTGLSTQTDTWTLGAGVGYTPTKNVEFRLGGAIGLLTSGSAGQVSWDGRNYGTDVAYDFDNDFVGALSTSVKVRF